MSSLHMGSPAVWGSGLPTTHLSSWGTPCLSPSHASNLPELRNPAWLAVTTEPKSCCGLLAQLLQEPEECWTGTSRGTVSLGLASSSYFHF